MTHSNMLRGVATISYFAADMKAAKQWYSELLGIEPYFQRPDAENPAYIEFRIGDYQHELGIIDSKYVPQLNTAASPAGVITYWHVDDVNASLERLVSMGAKELDAPQDRGSGFITASVIDPFGNVLGIMYNPHYVEILAAR